MKKVWIAALAVALFTSCSDSKNEETVKGKEGEVKSKLAADGWSESDYQEPQDDPSGKQ